MQVVAMGWALPPTYSAFKRERLLHGSSIVPPFLCESCIIPSLLKTSTGNSTDADHHKAITLDRMLRAEAVDAKREQYRHSKQAAMAIERNLQLRKHAARVLQKWLRMYMKRRECERRAACTRILRWWRRWKLLAAQLPRKELHMSYMQPKDSLPHSPRIHLQSTARRSQIIPPTPSAIEVPRTPNINHTSQSLPQSSNPHGLVLELLAVRGLVVASTWQSLSAEVCAFHKASPHTTLQTSHIPCDGGGFEWTGENVLAVGQHRLNLTEWHCSVKLYRHGGQMGAKCLGQVHLPADLLESSLAKHLTLTQWFPLEKAVPGDVVRGEVRLSFHYREEVAAISTIETIPPPNTQRKQVASIDAYSSDIPLRKKERQSRPGLQSPQTHEPKAKPDKRTPTATVATTVSPEKKKMLMSNSPSKLPDPLASNQAIANNDDSSSSKVVDTPTPHPYLKRKPYRIRFEKLDWSSVASKTDSNVPKAVPQQPPSPTPPSEQIPEKTGASLEQLMSAHNQRNLALVHLKQKAELHAIFHPPPPPSVLPTLTRPALGQLHRLPIGDTTRRLERHYDLLRQKWGL